MGTKAKPPGCAQRRRLCCLAASYITALALGVKREAEEDWGALKAGTKCGDAVSNIDVLGILVVIVLIVWWLAQRR